jgi:hypothetical protein
MQNVRFNARTFLGWQKVMDDVLGATFLSCPPAPLRQAQERPEGRAPGASGRVNIAIWVEQDPFPVTILRRASTPTPQARP